MTARTGWRRMLLVAGQVPLLPTKLLRQERLFCARTFDTCLQMLSARHCRREPNRHRHSPKSCESNLPATRKLLKNRNLSYRQGCQLVGICRATCRLQVLGRTSSATPDAGMRPVLTYLRATDLLGQVETGMNKLRW